MELFVLVSCCGMNEYRGMVMIFDSLRKANRYLITSLQIVLKLGFCVGVSIVIVGCSQLSKYSPSMDWLLVITSKLLKGGSPKELTSRNFSVFLLFVCHDGFWYDELSDGFCVFSIQLIWETPHAEFF